MIKLQSYYLIIDNILEELYKKESVLFEKELCERAIVFRFAYHLQKVFEGSGYFVDCDYNSSCFQDEKGNWIGGKGKPIADLETGEITGRFVDIIVHKRLLPESGQDSSVSDLICFECKKRDNKTKEGMKKDINNLRVLTQNYGYEYGFHLIFGKTKERCIIDVYHDGEKLQTIINP